MDKNTRNQTIKVIIILALIIAITIISTIVINATAFRHTEGLVYRTKTGNCYHSPGCGYLWNSSIPMGYKQAKSSSLGVCSRCGSTPKGTVTVNNYPLAFAITLLAEIFISLLILFIRHKLYDTPAPAPKANALPDHSSFKESSPPITTKPSPGIRQGSIVQHAKWGTGKVIRIEEKYITIWFASSEFKTYNDALKKFLYPDAVGKYFDVIEY